MTYCRLEIEFYSKRSGAKRPVFFNIKEHDLAQRWAGMLADLLRGSFPLEKNFLLLGWMNNGRDLNFLCERLNFHIAQVNQFFGERKDDLQYFIDLNFNSARVPKEDLNQIHHHFEILIGQVWKVSKFFEAASPDIRESIRELNHLCHEIEQFLKGLEPERGGVPASTIISAFTKAPRQDLKDEDYELFAPKLPFGSVRLHYAQLGKTHLEAFYDQDDSIGVDNISGLRFLTGEFDVSLDCRPKSRLAFLAPDFWDWLRKLGLDPTNKKLGIGYVTVAMLDRSGFQKKFDEDILEELYRYDDISRLAVHGQGKVTEAHYPS